MLENDYKLTARTTLTERLIRRELTKRDWWIGELLLLSVASKYYKRISLKAFGELYYNVMMNSTKKYIKEYYKSDE